MSALIQLHDVSLRLAAKVILDGINLQVQPREIVTLIGPNGAGKSSLVKLVSGLLAPTSGAVTRAPGLRMGYVPQRLQFDTSLPMNVGRFLALAGSDKHAQQACLAQLNIENLRATQLHNLSGGELQRVLLARAILRKPQLLLLDEPAQGVDVGGQIELYRTIVSLRDQLNCGVLMVSHDLHLVMAQTDTVYCLNRHMCCQGAPESVSQHPEYLQLFGQNSADIAIYTHHHDHDHNLQGDVVHSAECHHPHA